MTGIPNSTKPEGPMGLDWGRPKLQNVEHTQMVPKTGCAPSSQRQGHTTDMRVGEQFLEEHINTDRDSLLLLRQMVTTALAITARSFLEHVRDLKDCSQARVASQCSSIFLLLQLWSVCWWSTAFWDHALSCWAATQLTWMLPGSLLHQHEKIHCTVAGAVACARLFSLSVGTWLKA